jgi:hypothetical protein
MHTCDFKYVRIAFISAASATMPDNCRTDSIRYHCEPANQPTHKPTATHTNQPTNQPKYELHGRSRFTSPASTKRGTRAASTSTDAQSVSKHRSKNCFVSKNHLESDSLAHTHGMTRASASQGKCARTSLAA